MKTLLFLCLAMAWASSATNAADLSIDWFSIDSGGGTSAGGGYVLQGTLGQADASESTARGGDFSLIGGFWGVTLPGTVSGIPSLNVTLLPDGSVRIGWLPASPGFVLQQAESLSAAAWTDAASGSSNPATIRANTTSRFFRLRKP